VRQRLRISILQRLAARRNVGFHTLGEPNEYVYICSGPATFRVVNMNPRAAMVPVSHD
jgi:hypothetical protein